MLELNDIQHILLTRTPAITGRYEFLSFDTAEGGRAWLSELLDKVSSAADATATMDESDRWVTLAFTWTGLRALGVPEDSLQTFPEEFRAGMASRADILGVTGNSAPEHWVGGLAGDDLHAIAILFARNDEQCKRSIANHDELLARTDGVRSLSYLDLNATPPFNYAHDHFGFRDRLSQPVMKGSGEEPTPGSGAALEPGEFILGYPDEDGELADAPAEPLRRNGSFMVYRKFSMDVARFTRFLREAAERTRLDEELLAAKIVGRWRDGTPLVLSPERPDHEIAIHPDRVDDFRYEGDPEGLLCPLGAHIRRANPRDSMGWHGEMTKRHRMIRRGISYGHPPADPAVDDGVDRGLIFTCFVASIERQFEVVQSTWLNDGNVFGIGEEKDFMLAGEDSKGKMVVHGRPPAILAPRPQFVRVRGGEYLFQPGIAALRALAEGVAD